MYPTTGIYQKTEGCKENASGAGTPTVTYNEGQKNHNSMRTTKQRRSPLHFNGTNLTVMLTATTGRRNRSNCGQLAWQSLSYIGLHCCWHWTTTRDQGEEGQCCNIWQWCEKVGLTVDCIAVDVGWWQKAEWFQWQMTSAEKLVQDQTALLQHWTTARELWGGGHWEKLDLFQTSSQIKQGGVTETCVNEEGEVGPTLDCITFNEDKGSGSLESWGEGFWRWGVEEEGQYCNSWRKMRQSWSNIGLHCCWH